MEATNANQALFHRIGYLLLAPTLALLLLFVTLRVVASAGKTTPSMAQNGPSLYVPAVFSAASPAGSYLCYEYEFGLIWTSEVITLNIDGSSVYNYAPPYSGVVTGTWVYTPTIQQVGFTNFRWLTATYEAPDRLWASRYLPHVDFTIAIDCGRR